MTAPLRVYTEPHILRGQGLNPVDLRLDPGSQVDVTRPEGPGYVRFEDLYQPGDSITDAFDRMTEPAVVTFPEGVFELHGFPYNMAAIDCRRGTVRGIVGSGSGQIHDPNSSGTIFQLVENSSGLVPGDPGVPKQEQGGTNQLRVIRAIDTEGPAEFRNFQVRGSEQGHNFNGLSIFSPHSSVVVSNVKVSGIPGDLGYPPGETFSLTVYPLSAHPVLIENCEVDGRWSGDERAVSISASGMTVGQSSGGAVIRNCRTHHHGGGALVLYRTVGVLIEDCFIGTPDYVDHLLNPDMRPAPVSQEETTGTVHRNCAYAGSAIRPTVHVNHSNTNRTLTVGGVPTSFADGSLEIINPRYTDIRGSKSFYLQSWTTGVDGTSNNDSLVTPPTVLGPDGVTPMAYIWAHGGNTTINPEHPPTGASILEGNV